MTLARCIIGPLIVAISGIIMCIWTWGTWPDPVIDFGREIYVPWRLAEGEVLYRDIVSYFNGPLSPYTHALLFKIFGPSLRVLVIFNVVLIALLAGMLYVLVLRISGHLAATVSGLAFFVLFAFAQFLQTGNYNYVCPYSYELSHGITLTVGTILAMSAWIRSDRMRWLAIAGALLGLIFLTKAEVFLAAVVAQGVGLIGALLARRVSPRRWLRDLSLFGATMMIAPLIAAGVLSLAMPASEALRGLLGAWRWVGDRTLTDLPYFRQLAGTDDIPGSLHAIWVASAAYAAMAGFGLVAGIAARRPRLGWIVSLAIFAMLVGFGVLNFTQINWNNLIRPAPVLLITSIAVLAVAVVRRRQVHMILPLMVTTWSLALLAKMPLNAHIYHYGFALAMPATLLCIVMLIDWLPRLMERSVPSNGWPMRGVFAAALVVAMYAHVSAMNYFFTAKTRVVGTGADRFRADERGTAVNALVKWLDDNADPKATLLAMPEGLLVSYLTRRANPTGQLNFTPPAIIMYGEEQMLSAIQTNPPDYVAQFSIDASEYGAAWLGRDYGGRINFWVLQNYDYVTRFRSRAAFGRVLEIVLLKRRQAPIHSR